MQNKLNCVFVLEWQTPEDLDTTDKGNTTDKGKRSLLLFEQQDMNHSDLTNVFSCFILEFIH